MKTHYTSIFEKFPTRTQSLWQKGSFNKMKKIPLLVLSQQDYVFFRNKNNSLTQIPQLILFDSYLLMPERYINLENLRLQKINFQALSGLKISSNYESVEIYSTDPLICKMYNIIKRFTIQMDFQFKFLKLKCLGKGSFAKVYKIMSMEDKTQYATKQFTKNPNNQDIHAAQISIFKEIGILRKIEHENIIKLYEVYEDENHIYLILDLLEGGELLEALETRKDGYDENLAQNVIWQLLTAVNYLHTCNILHRDIKPENIILRKKNKLSEIAIADFGLAEIYNEQSNYLYPQCGTIGYAAPEIYQGIIYDRKVDIFSIGAVMYMLLSGEPAFQGGNSKEELKNNMECNVNFDKLKQKCIRDNGIDLCRKLLEKDYKLRFSAQQALNHDWFHTPVMDSFPATNLSINIIPQIKVKMQPDILKSSSPLWRNDSPLTSHSSKSHSYQLIPDNDQGVDYIDEGHYFKQFQDFEQDSDLIEDIDQNENLSVKIQKYQTLSKEISMSRSYKDIK